MINTNSTAIAIQWNHTQKECRLNHNNHFLEVSAYTDSGNAHPSQSKSEIESSKKIRGEFTFQTHQNNKQNKTTCGHETKSRGLTDNAESLANPIECR